MYYKPYIGTRQGRALGSITIDGIGSSGAHIWHRPLIEANNDGVQGTKAGHMA